VEDPRPFDTALGHQQMQARVDVDPEAESSNPSMNGQSIQEIQKFLFGELRVPNDFKQETGSDIFASMYWNDCHSPIGMAHDDVASLLANL